MVLACRKTRFPPICCCSSDARDTLHSIVHPLPVTLDCLYAQSVPQGEVSYSSLLVFSLPPAHVAQPGSLQNLLCVQGSFPPSKLIKTSPLSTTLTLPAPINSENWSSVFWISFCNSEPTVNGTIRVEVVFLSLLISCFH